MLPAEAGTKRERLAGYASFIVVLYRGVDKAGETRLEAEGMISKFEEDVRL